MNTFSSHNNENFTLKNGLMVTIRPILPEDKSALQEFFTHLSPESIYFRFLEYKKNLSDDQAIAFANVDYKNRMAFVAVIDEEKARIIGVARYSSLSPDQPGKAEVGVVIEDAFQSFGLGTHLLQTLSRYALDQGINTFVGAIAPANLRILKFIEKTGLTFQRHYSEGVWEVEINLTDW